MRSPLHPGLPDTLAKASLDLQKQFGGELSAYAEFVSKAEPKGPKVINDPIWRTVRLEPWEAVVVDSPLFQRLRRIRQLGLVGYVYPSAGYSRFEHSIGVLHQTQRVIDAVNRNARAFSARRGLPPELPIPHFEETRLRLTALLHDCGHGFMSHVSERAIERTLRIGDKRLSELRHEASQHFSCPKAPALAEVLSALLILLPEFCEVLSQARIPDWEDTRALAFEIARVIVGGRDATRPFLTEILSGSLDADKLDYMPRDCYMAGLPMPVDVDRILEKLIVVEIPASQLEYRAQFGLEGGELVRVLALQSTGTRSFEELVVSRALLFQKLYYHQKVRAMEGMVTNAIELLAKDADPFKKLSTYLKMADDEFLLGNWGEWEQTPACVKARDLVKQVVTRRPFVRALAFGPTLVAKEGGWPSLSALVEDKGRTDLRQRLSQRAKEYLGSVGQPGLAEDLDEHLLLIDLPDVQGIVASTRFFISDDQLGPRKYGEGHEARRWTEAYEVQNTLGYVYCPGNVALAVHLAFRDLIWEELGVVFKPESWSLAKQPMEGLASFSKQLQDKGVKTLPFNVPEAAKLIARLRNTDPFKRELLQRYATEIESLEHRFRTYKSSDNRVASRLEIQDWLMQFPHDDIPLAVRALAGVNFWDRAALADALLTGVEQLGLISIPSIQVFGLGGSTTSAQHLSYLWNDVREKLAPKLTVLNSIDEAQVDVPLVLFDDNVGSGGQSSTVLLQWFGRDKSEWLVDEYHVAPLQNKILDNLRATDISICYVTGKRSGLRKVLDTAGQLLGREVRGAVTVPTDLSCFSAAARIWPTQDDANRARGIFAEVGTRSLQDRREEKSSEWIEQRALGYGNAGGLTAFFYNTPTTTLTALWKDCEEAGSNWKALFPRRARPSSSSG